MKIRLEIMLLLAALIIVGCKGSQDKPAPIDKALTKEAYSLVAEGKTEELRKFLAEHPELVDAPNSHDTALLETVIDMDPPFPNRYQSMKVLLEAGADPNLEAPDCLRKAIWRQDPEALQMLLDHNADPMVVWEKKKMNMIEYAQSYEDERFDRIFETWEKKNKKP
jgi:hypothetical protein